MHSIPFPIPPAREHSPQLMNQQSHIISQSPEFTFSFTRYCAISRFYGICGPTSTMSHTTVYALRKNPRTLPSHPSPAPTPWCLLTVSVSHLWIFPEQHLDRIQQHLPLSEWLSSLSSWCWHAYYVSVRLDDSPLWGTESYSVLYYGLHSSQRWRKLAHALFCKHCTIVW